MKYKNKYLYKKEKGLWCTNPKQERKNKPKQKVLSLNTKYLKFDTGSKSHLAFLIERY